MLRKYAHYAILILLCAGIYPVAVSSQNTQQQMVDRIAAVVGNEIILLSDVQRLVQAEMMVQGLDENSPPQQLQQLLNDILQSMIDEKLLIVKAQTDSIEVDVATVNDMEKQQFNNMRAQYANEDAFQQALVDYGITEPQLRYMIRNMMLKNQLQDRIIQTIMRGISVTPQEMEAWVAANQDSIDEIPAQYRLSHILRYPQVSPERKQAAYERMQELRERIVAGEDFAELAEQYSDDPGTNTVGGDIGYFRRNEMVTEFSQAAYALTPGEISEIVETQFGYHLIKVEDIRGDEVRARHILFLLEPNEEDNEATVALLNRIRDDINTGDATFEQMAKEYSEDENSNQLGGRLTWLRVDAGIDAFMERAPNMEIGDISEPFESQFGFHIIRLDNIRPAHKINVKDDNNDIRQMVQNQKSMAELDRILNELRERTYIRISL